jgi:autotransporter-associated beta strand protein
MQYIRFISAATVVSLCAAFPFSLWADQDYTWNKEGGNGTWNNALANWWNGSALVSGQNFGAMGEAATLNFINTGTITKQFTATPYADESLRHVLKFHGNSDYTILGVSAGNGYINSGISQLAFEIASTATFTLGGNGYRVGIISTSTLFSLHGITLKGGGAVNLRSGGLIRSGAAGSMAVQEGTKLSFFEGSRYTGNGGVLDNTPTDFGRLAVEGGEVAIDGGVVFAGYSAGNSYSVERSYGISIGAVSAASDATAASFTLTSGTVIALGDPRDTANAAAGIVFGGTSSANKGGRFDLKGGTLVVSNIHSSESLTHSLLNLDGGTIFVSTTVSSASTVNSIANAEYQSRLDNFISGFAGTADNHVNIGDNGVTIDTSSIDTARTNGIATIASGMQGAGALTKAGTNTLRLTGSNSYSGGTVINDGILEGNSASLQGVITNNATLVFNQLAHGTYAGQMQGIGVMTKRGIGALTITGDIQSFTGQTTIIEGGLYLSNVQLGGSVQVVNTGTFGGVGTVLGSLDMQSGASLDVGGFGTAGVLNIQGNMTLSGNSLLFDLYGSGVSDQLNVGSLTQSGEIIIEIGQFVSGTFSLGNNLAGLNNAKIKIDGFLVEEGARKSGTLQSAGDGLQLITTAGHSLELIWGGSAGTTWDPLAANWSGVANGVFASGDRVIFDDTADASASVRRNIEIATPGVIVSDIIVTGTGDYTFTGAGITADAASAVGDVLTSPSGKLTKLGTGILTLANGANNFKGGIDLNGGILAFGDVASIGSETITIGAAGTTLMASGNGVNLANNILLNHTVSVDTPLYDMELAGIISGSGKILKTGDSALILSGTNTMAGIDLAAGILAIKNGGAVGGQLAAMGAGVALRFDTTGIDFVAPIDLGSIGMSFDTAGNTVELSGMITGSGTFIKSGSGILTVSGINSGFSGDIAVNGGTLAVASLDKLGLGTGAIAIGGSGVLAVTPGASGDLIINRALGGDGILAVDLWANANTLSFASSIGAGFTGKVKLGRGTILLDAATTNELAGASVALLAGSMAEIKSTASIAGLVLNGGILKIAMETSGSAPENLLSVNHLEIVSGTIAINLAALDAGTIVNPGTPSLFEQSQLSNTKLIDAVTVSGTETMLAIVQLDGSPYTLPLHVDITQTSGGVTERVGIADYNYVAQAAEGGLYLGTGLTQISINSGKMLLLDNSDSASSTLSAKLTGGGGVELRATGTITLAGIGNDFDGPTLLSQGTVKAAVANALGNSSDVTLVEGTLFDTGGFSQKLGNLAGAGDIVFASGTLTIHSSADTTFAGNLEGTTGRIIKTGTAGVILTGSNAFSGGLEIRSGILHAIGEQSYGSGPLVILPDGALRLENADRDFNEAITGGGALEFINSNARLTTANTLSAFTASGQSNIKVTQANAFGGPTAKISIVNGSRLEMVAPTSGSMALNAGVLTVDGGTLLFGVNTSIKAASVSFKNHGRVELSNPFPTGEYTLITTTGGITSDNPSTYLPDYSKFAHGMEITLLREGKNLVMHAYNQAANPGKDVAMIYNTVLASMGTIYNRVSETFLTPLAGRTDIATGNEFWLRGFGSSADYEDNPAQIGFSDFTYGAMVGCDRIFNERWLFGAWFGAANSRLETVNDADTDAEQQMGGVYGALKAGKLYFGIDASGGMLQASTKRHEQLGYAHGSYKGDFIAASAEVGAALVSWENGTLRPSAAVHYLSMNFKDHTESGVGAIRVADFRHDVWQTYMRMTLNQKFTTPWGGIGLVDVSAGWRHNLHGAACTVDMAYLTDPENRFSVDAGGYARGSAVLGFSLGMAVTDDCLLAIGYDYETASSRNRHSVDATVRIMW